MDHRVAHTPDNAIIYGPAFAERQNSDNSTHYEGGPFVSSGSTRECTPILESVSNRAKSRCVPELFDYRMFLSESQFVSGQARGQVRRGHRSGRKLTLDFKCDARRHELIVQRDRRGSRAKRVGKCGQFFAVAFLGGPRGPHRLTPGRQNNRLKVIDYDHLTVYVDFTALFGVRAVSPTPYR